MTKSELIVLWMDACSDPINNDQREENVKLCLQVNLRNLILPDHTLRLFTGDRPKIVYFLSDGGILEYELTKVEGEYMDKAFVGDYIYDSFYYKKLVQTQVDFFSKSALEN